MSIRNNVTKFVFLITISALTAILFVGCAQTTSQPVNPKNEEAHNAYQQVLEEARKVNQESGSLQKSSGWIDNYAETLKYIIFDAEKAPTKYIYQDLDNDGVDELILYNGEFITQVFGYIDGAVCKTMYGWSRSFYNLTNDNMLIYKGSGGAALGEISAIKYEVKNPASYVHDANTTTVEEINWEPITNTQLKLTTKVNGTVEKTENIDNSQLNSVNKSFEAKYSKIEVEWQDI